MNLTPKAEGATIMQKNFLKYVAASFIPVLIYAILLISMPEKPSFLFMLIFSITIGFIGQYAFRKYIEG